MPYKGPRPPPGSRKGICTNPGCGKPTPVDPSGNFRYCCSEECRAARAITGAKNAAAARRTRLAQQESHCERPECGAAMPRYQTSGELRRFCCVKCAQLMYGETMRRARARRCKRSAGETRVYQTQAGHQRVSRRICDTCCDQSERRDPVTGCSECGLPYGKEPRPEPRATFSAIAEARRWA